MNSPRSATPADVAEIVRLEVLLFGVDAWSTATVEQSIADDQVLVCDLSGHVVVSVAGDTADLQRIAVDLGRRRAGIAHTLLEQAVARARTSGVDRMLLEVRADNAVALAFYAAEGFAEIDRRRRYYRDGADAIVMELALAQGR